MVRRMQKWWCWNLCRTWKTACFIIKVCFQIYSVAFDIAMMTIKNGCGFLKQLCTIIITAAETRCSSARLAAWEGKQVGRRGRSIVRFSENVERRMSRFNEFRTPPSPPGNNFVFKSICICYNFEPVNEFKPVVHNQNIIVLWYKPEWFATPFGRHVLTR